MNAEVIYVTENGVGDGGIVPLLWRMLFHGLRKEMRFMWQKVLIPVVLR